MTAARIAVVVIVHNGDDLLAEALESLVAQTADDWEAVVVDDGSTDGSRAIAERFAARDTRMTVLSHEDGANHGMSASRNLGIARTHADYVTFLDHDDVMLPGKLADQAAILDAHADVDVAMSPVLRWHAQGGGDDVVQPLHIPTGVAVPPPGPLPGFLTDTHSTPLAVMVRRTMLERIGGYEDAFRSMYEDQVFLSKLFLEATTYVAPKVSHWYRQHPGSCVMRAFRDGSQLVARRRFLLWLDAHLNEYPALAPAVAPHLRGELARTRFARTRALLKRFR